MNINDLPFNPKYEQGGVDAAKAWLIDNLDSFDTKSNFCVVNNDGSEVAGFTNRYCHGALLGEPQPGRSLIGTEIAAGRKRLLQVIDPWLKWLLYDSYYSRFILNRDDYDFCKSYGIIVSCDMPAPLMQNIMIISRAPVESTIDAFKLFNKLLGEGYDPALLYMFIFCSSISTLRDGGYSSGAVTCRLGNHVPYRLCSQPNGLKRYVNGDFGSSLADHASTRIYRDNHDYSGGLAYFPAHWLDGIHLASPLLLEALVEARKTDKESEGYAPPNPFAPPSRAAPSQSQYPTVTEFIEVILPLLQKEISTS